MSEAGTILVILLIVLAIVAVVGHGIWVGTAWFFRTILGVKPRDDRGRRALAGTCPRCRDGELVQGKCWTCGFFAYQNEPTATPQIDERAIVIRHLRRLYESDAIDAGTFERVMAAVQRGKAAAPVVAAAPVEVP